MHIADPDLGIFGANGIVGRRPADRRRRRHRRAAAGRRQRRGRVLRRRRGRPGRVPRGGEPRRGVAAAGRLLLREQRLRRVLRRRRTSTRRRSSSGPPATASTTSRSTATTSWPPPTAMARGGRRASAPAAARSIVEATTYRWHGHYEGDPSATATPRSCEEWEERDPLVVHAARLRDGGRRRRRRSPRSRRRWPTSSTPRSTRPGALAEPAPCRRCSTSSSARGPSAPSRRRSPADAPVFRTMDAVRAALEAELDDRRAGVRRRHRRRRRRQRLRPHPRPARPVRRPGARHADLGDGDHGPRRRRGDGRACARWSS